MILVTKVTPIYFSSLDRADLPRQCAARCSVYNLSLSNGSSQPFLRRVRTAFTATISVLSLSYLLPAKSPGRIPGQPIFLPESPSYFSSSARILRSLLQWSSVAFIRSKPSSARWYVLALLTSCYSARASVIGVVYRKALVRIDTSGIVDSTTSGKDGAAQGGKADMGKVVSLIGSDVGQVASLPGIFDVLTQGPINLAILCWFLYSMIGFSAFVGYVIFLVVSVDPKLPGRRSNCLDLVQVAPYTSWCMTFLMEQYRAVARKRGKPYFHHPLECSDVYVVLETSALGRSASCCSQSR